MFIPLRTTLIEQIPYLQIIYYFIFKSPLEHRAAYSVLLDFFPYCRAPLPYNIILQSVWYLHQTFLIFHLKAALTNMFN